MPPVFRAFKEVKKRLAETMGRVTDDHAPIVITRGNGRNVVLMSQEHFRRVAGDRLLARHTVLSDLRLSIGDLGQSGLEGAPITASCAFLQVAFGLQRGDLLAGRLQ